MLSTLLSFCVVMLPHEVFLRSLLFPQNHCLDEICPIWIGFFVPQNDICTSQKKSFLLFPLQSFSEVTYPVLSLFCSEWVVYNTAEVTFTKVTLTLCPTAYISSSNFLSDCSLDLITLGPRSVLCFFHAPFLRCNLGDITAAFGLLNLF